jgi:hypothetical protein
VTYGCDLIFALLSNSRQGEGAGWFCFSAKQKQKQTKQEKKIMLMLVWQFVKYLALFDIFLQLFV